MINKNPLQTILGRLAVEEGTVSRPQLDHTLRLQRQNGSYRPLGEIMVEQGYLSQETLGRLLSRQQMIKNTTTGFPLASPKKRLLGEVLIEEKLARPEQVYQCLSEQARLAEQNITLTLGQLLVSHGHVGAETLKEAIRLQHVTLVTCQDCSAQFNIKAPVEEIAGWVPCPRCGGAIRQASDEADVTEVAGELAAPRPY